MPSLQRDRDARKVKVPFDPDLKFSKPTWHPIDIDDAVADARRRGAEDGRVGVPGSGDSYCQHIESLKNQAEQTLNAVAWDWDDMHRVLKEEWSRLWHIAEERASETPGLEKEVKRVDVNVGKREKTVDARRKAIEDLGPNERHRMSRILYFLGMAAVFGIDVPLNIFVFDLFGESPLLTYIAAGLLGILIVPAAHVLGIQLRSRFNDKVITALASAIPLALIVAMAVLRRDYLKSEHALAKSLGGGTGALIFIALNIAIFGGGIFLSYLRHDPYEHALEEAERALREAKAERAVAEDRLQMRKREVAEIQGQMAKLRSQAEQEFSKAKNRAHTERNFCERLMHEYAGANKANRQHPGEPVKVLDDPTVWDVPTIPNPLRPEDFAPWMPPSSGVGAALPATS